ncbi:MAG: endopeptidase La [Oscillospiraceae bacterium]|nr:endopeptidase La [Oscillospiraceae bacterium]
MNKKTTNEIIPAISLRGLVVFPSMVLHFDVGRERSVNALKAAADESGHIFLVAQKDASITDPELSDMYEVGVIAEVRQLLTTPDGSTRVLVEGISRARRVKSVGGKDYLRFEVKELPTRSGTISESTAAAASRALKNIFAEYAQISPKMPRELFESIMTEENCSELFDKVVFNVVLKVEDKQALLEANGLLNRIKMLISMLETEIEIIETEIDIQEQVKEQVDKNQRDYYLREQLRAIYKQLGEGDNPQEEADNYIEKIRALNLSDEVTEKLVGEAQKLVKMSYSSQEAGVIRSYLDTVLELPWNIRTKDKLDIDKVEKQLDKDHYGLKKVKERITEIISVRALSPDVKGQIICLYGPPGVGKTSIGRSIADALGRKYVRISLGGVHDEAEIRGHRKTYIGAMPGRIAAALKQAKSMNPVMLLDEIDKMGSDYKGDPASAMLEVLDSEQNTTFTDHYLEIPLDLSDVLFITTANSLDTIPAPLLDRMEVIELSSYTREEKFNIAKKHLLPKQLKKHGEKPSTVKINDKALYSVIDFYTREAGVRKLERSIADICRKSAKKLVSGEKKVTVTDQNITEFLGVKKYLPEHLAAHDEVGLVNGLAWTSVGGVTMPLEVLVLDGTGKTEFTGSLGEVMKESAKIAVSLTRSLARKYNIDPDFYKNKDIHVHAPEGAVPKDGPSAGVTLTTALVSALSGTPVRRDVAMTGEITLRGKVLAIGGLKEKTMAAYRAGVKTVCIPKENEPDIDELDDVVKNSLKFVVAEDISTVLETALVLPNVAPEKKAPLKRRASTKTKAEDTEKIPALNVN